MTRISASVECGSGLICIHLPDRELTLSHMEAHSFLRNLVWAVGSSQEEWISNVKKERLHETYRHAN